MAESVVINTGPLVALARGEILSLGGALPYVFVCPTEVRVELDEGVAQGHPAVDAPWLHVVQLSVPLHPVATATLDVGEAAVLQLALERGISTVCLDDWKGRRAAVAAGLRVTGSLGLLVRAKTLGLLPALAPVIATIVRRGVWYDPALVRQVLAAVGE